MKTFIQQILRDKDGCYSLREVIIMLLVIAVLASWIAKQFFNKDVPEFMFWSFISLIGGGCFGYSLEKKTTSEN